MHKHFNLIALLTLLYTSGCAVVAVGAIATAAGTTAVVATDPRNSGTVVDDNTISTKLQARLANNFSNSNIYVTCYNGAVLLTGQAKDSKIKQEAAFEAKTIPGVKQVYNYLEIRLNQGFSSRTEDAYTTTQIKTKLLGMNNISSNDIKVVTTNSIVYLLGIITKEQAKQVADTAASINDVSKVVTLFEYKS